MSSKFKKAKRKGGIAGVLKRKIAGTVDVGIIDAGDHDSGDLTVATIGYINEFGTENIPERSFIRSVLFEQRKAVLNLKKKLYAKVLRGDVSEEKALGLLGEFLKAKIVDKIVSLKTPPNAPSTIRAKGTSNPLVASGQLKNSITYGVNR